MNMGDENPGMAILQKAGAILQMLEGAGEASVAQIADTVDEPVSSTYRLLSSLTGIGWVDRAAKRGRYRLGLEVVRIGALLEGRIDVRRVCEPVLFELRDRTKDTAFLCYRRGTSAVCVDRIGGHNVQSQAMRVGDSFNLYHGAAPLAILSFLPIEERNDILDQFDTRRAQDARIPGREFLEDSIAAARSAGFAISDEDVTPGIAAIGAPIFNHRSELVGSISISGLKSRLFEVKEETVNAVLAAAKDASNRLGCVTPPTGISGFEKEYW